MFWLCSLIFWTELSAYCPFFETNWRRKTIAWSMLWLIARHMERQRRTWNKAIKNYERLRKMRCIIRLTKSRMTSPDVSIPFIRHWFHEVLSYIERKENEEFYRWLLPLGSYGLVSTELLAIRNKRGKSLRWALDLPQLHAWQTSVTGTKENVLSIQDRWGIGKSTMVGYFIDKPSSEFSRVYVVYVFCKRGINGFTGACHILQNLAYQFSLAHPEVRSKLKDAICCQHKTVA